MMERIDWRNEWRRFREVQWGSLELGEAGSWPRLLQGLCCAMVLAIGIFAAQWYLVAPRQQALDAARVEEENLLSQYGTRAWQAANLPLLEAQMGTLDIRMAALIGMLPTDAEVPALLDSISELARREQLDIDFLRLQSPVAHDFYTEQPFDIQVRGDYHRLAAFVSGVAGLSRIVTLHDFTLAPRDAENPGAPLVLSMLARTYRYDADSKGSQTGSVGEPTP